MVSEYGIIDIPRFSPLPLAHYQVFPRETEALVCKSELNKSYQWKKQHSML